MSGPLVIQRGFDDAARFGGGWLRGQGRLDQPTGCCKFDRRLGVGWDGRSFGGIALGGGLEEGIAAVTDFIGLLDEKGATLAGAGLAGTAAAAFSIGLSSP